MKIEEALAICRKDPTQAFYLDYWSKLPRFYAYSIRFQDLFKHEYEMTDEYGPQYICAWGCVLFVQIEAKTDEFLSYGWRTIEVGAS